MKYTEAKDQSAEFLRMALAHMGRHEASFNPVTFTVWYEYAATINARLNAAVDLLLSESASMDDEKLALLYEKYIAPADDGTIERIGGKIQRVMTGIATSAAKTGDHASEFGNQLSELSTALQTKDVSQLTPRLGAALRGTAQMRTTTRALQEQLRESQTEITQLRADLERSRGEAFIDPLTRILNRKGFDQKLQALCEEPATADRQHCLIMFDIDHFKKVNDSHGHLVGDRVIQGLGDILRGTLGLPTESAARYGGDEFAILLAHSTLADAARLSELVRARVKAMKVRHRNTNEVAFNITVSGGVATMREGDTAATLIARADGALYRSKNDGRDRMSAA